MSKRMPAEWEPHDSTWLAWPHQKSDWLDAFPQVRFAYLEIIKALSRFELVHVLCANEEVESEAVTALKGLANVEFHRVPNDRSWLRDSAPTFVFDSKKGGSWAQWTFNAWSRYDNFLKDAHVASRVAELSGLPSELVTSPFGNPVVLEGGAIDSDGQGTLLVTEECLLSSVQSRNPGLEKEQYEEIFREVLGTKRCIWLGKGVPGDDTHGHIDGICRFVSPAKVLLCAPDGPGEEFSDIFEDNVARIEAAADAEGRDIEIVPLPLPEKRYYEDQLLPASYANFYIANSQVLVPTFQDAKDEQALAIFKECFPKREIVGIDCSSLIVGMGAIHCITQPQFSSNGL